MVVWQAYQLITSNKWIEVEVSYPQKFVI